MVYEEETGVVPEVPVTRGSGCTDDDLSLGSRVDRRRWDAWRSRVYGSVVGRTRVVNTRTLLVSGSGPSQGTTGDHGVLLSFPSTGPVFDFPHSGTTVGPGATTEREGRGRWELGEHSEATFYPGRP